MIMLRFTNPTILRPPNTENLPVIAIVTPCLNQVNFLEATVHSILDQGYPKLEYIIIDGGSIDGSVNIIEKYSDYLSYWQSKSDSGQYYAINDGFNHSTGEIMAWLNADDMLHRNALWSVAEIFRSFPEIEWLIGTPTRFDLYGRAIQVSPGTRWSRISFISGNYRWIQQESVFWRRSLWNKAGGSLNTSFQYAADFELWTRYFSFARLYSTRAILAGFRARPGQRSKIHRDEYENEAKKIHQNLSLTKSERTNLMWISLMNMIGKHQLVKNSLHYKNIYTKLLDLAPFVYFDLSTNEFKLDHT